MSTFPGIEGQHGEPRFDLWTTRRNGMEGDGMVVPLKIVLFLWKWQCGYSNLLLTKLHNFAFTNVEY
jgi:hypothetical protein